MSERERNTSSPNWLIFGLVASIAAAGAVGAVLYRIKHSTEQVADRDVKEMIRECQSTIEQMDSALESLKATTRRKVGLSI